MRKKGHLLTKELISVDQVVFSPSKNGHRHAALHRLTLIIFGAQDIRLDQDRLWMIVVDYLPNLVEFVDEAQVSLPFSDSVYLLSLVSSIALLCASRRSKVF